MCSGVHTTLRMPVCPCKSYQGTYFEVAWPVKRTARTNQGVDCHCAACNAGHVSAIVGVVEYCFAE